MKHYTVEKLRNYRGTYYIVTFNKLFSTTQFYTKPLNQKDLSPRITDITLKDIKTVRYRHHSFTHWRRIHF
jgi:recombinational DNA repair protein RecR